MDGSGNYKRGVSVKSSSTKTIPAVPGRVAVYYFNVKNTGKATDLIRLNVKTQANWETMLENNVIEVKAGESVDIPVYVKIPLGGKNNQKPTPNKLTLTTTSETDSSKQAKVERWVGPGQVK